MRIKETKLSRSIFLLCSINWKVVPLKRRKGISYIKSLFIVIYIRQKHPHGPCEISFCTNWIHRNQEIHVNRVKSVYLKHLWWTLLELSKLLYLFNAINIWDEKRVTEVIHQCSPEKFVFLTSETLHCLIFSRSSHLCALLGKEVVLRVNEPVTSTSSASVDSPLQQLPTGHQLRFTQD